MKKLAGFIVYAIRNTILIFIFFLAMVAYVIILPVYFIVDSIEKVTKRSLDVIE